MKRLVPVGLAIASLALACTEKGRSVVLVNLTAASGVTGVDEVQVHVVRPNGGSIHHAQGGRPPVMLGVYLDKSFSGDVQVQACGFTTGHELIAASVPIRGIKVAPADTVGPINAELVVDPTVVASSVCASSGGGGAGGSGAGGTGGGGSAGGAGAGGSAGGTGGGGGGGAGGVAGAGGVSGSGGGTGGRGGTGGAAGTGGGAGNGGVAGSSAGRGGTGGTGGSGGAAGRGGTGGTGGGTAGAAGWHGPVPVSGNQSADVRPSVAVPYTGNAVIVYERGPDIYSVRYDAGQGLWSSPMVVAAGQYGLPQIAAEGSGRFTVIWGAATGAATNKIWRSASDDGINWAPAMELSPTGSYAFKPVLAVNSGGTAIAAWLERVSGSSTEQVVAAIRTNGAWSAPELMRAGEDANDRHPAVAITDVGEGIVVWEQIDPNTNLNSVWVRQFDRINMAWAPQASLLDMFDGGAATAPAIAVNPAGTAIVTYLQRVSANTAQLFARRYTGANWAPPQMVGQAPNIDATQPPSVWLDDNGTATVAWAADVAAKYNVHTNRALQNGTFGALTMEIDNQAGVDMGAGQAPLPVVRGDGKGSLIMVWRKRFLGETRFDIVASQYTGGSWGAPALIETADANGAFAPVLGTNGQGDAVAAWYYGGTSLDVFANAFRR